MSSPEELIPAARRAALKAHAPYSHFRVGAVVRCSNGEIVEGCNVENASYGLSICAERVALFNAITRGLQPEELAVSCLDAPSDGPDGLRMPCGACRQVMLELMAAEATVHIDGVGSRRLAELLPDAFSLVADNDRQ